MFLHGKLNITSNVSSLLVGKTDVSTVNNFLTVPLVRWWPALVKF